MHSIKKGRNVLKLTLRTVPICLVFFSPILRLQAQTADATASLDAVTQRTVMGTEYGSIFAKPNGFPYSDFGIYIGASKYSTMLNPAAIKGHYSRFHHAGPADSSLGFPYTALRQYEAQQVAAGRPRIFITATYNGKRRPVVERGSLRLDSYNRPTAPSSQWVYPINVRDQRYITFWITKYARPVVLAPMAYLRNAWVYVDGCTLLYTIYGVLDDNNRFVAGVRWDQPFPQSGNEFQASIGTFLNAVKSQAPDIKIIADMGSLSNPSAFSTTYASLEGFTQENLWGWGPTPSSWVINNWATTIFPWYRWVASQGRVSLLGAFLPSNYGSGALLSSFVTYELIKGVNSFFAPRVGGTALPLSSGWMNWASKLGTPVGSYSDNNHLFSRRYSYGYVYLNWTGRTQTITLPAGTWYNPSNQRVTRISIPTWKGTFVNR
jgi:hypothetical protein